MERRAIAIHGTVQGVGFRPFVYALASRFELGGFVKNHTGGVKIEVEGEADPLDHFLSELVKQPPPLARIDALSWRRESVVGERRFRIEASESVAAAQIVIAPDAATCDDCLAELFDPRDRRYLYPFLNCTNCGPRLTIVKAAPYDRQRTTMAGFTMCAACRAEYEDPTNRRFHAQPSACPVCGPQLTLLDSSGEIIETSDALAAAAEAIEAGKIVAIKGLGGYHLACDARHRDAVKALRARKHREEKPFAVMVGDLTAARELCDVSIEEQELLASRRRPIVLLRKRATIDLADEVAPQNPFLGVMLPYTPLHHLLMARLNGMPLVMTSGNRSDEPIAFDEPDAIERLRGIADLFVIHNRPIHVRCDDSVTRIVGGIESPLRRSRGDAPQPIPLSITCPAPILAVGGQMKATFALGSDRRAILSHHLGDLDNFEAYRAFERDAALYEDLFGLRPAMIAHDLHPDYASTRYAIDRAAHDGIAHVAVQHHHAHMASCMAEHRLVGPVIGVTFDGTGFGTDGAVWGGEFLIGDFVSVRRAVHLRYVAMPGGEQAIREPWRMAASHLHDANATCDAYERRIAPTSLQTIRAMIERNLNTPNTSSAGRLFDAVASLAGVRDAVAYEGQAAMQLEWLATTVSPDSAYPFNLSPLDNARVAQPHSPSLAVSQTDSPSGLRNRKRVNQLFLNQGEITVDTRPMIRAIAHDVDAGISSARIARRFHSTLVEIIAHVCATLREQAKLDRVVLSGGVFMNALLSTETNERLTRDGFRVFRHRIVPPNDGGLSLGQIAVAACRGAS